MSNLQRMESRHGVDGGTGDGRLEGLQITGGYGQYRDGGGLHIFGSDLVITDCVITNNRATTGANWGTGYGGGIYGIASYVVMTNCDLSGNAYVNAMSGQGGGAYIQGGSWLITHSTIISNTCFAWYNSNPLPLSRGGGLHISGGNHQIRNTLIAGNNTLTTPSLGDGLYVNANLSMDFCTVANNFGQGFEYGGGSVTISNSILWGNIDDVAGFPYNLGDLNPYISYSCVSNGDNNGLQGCVNVDPLFVDARYFHLQSRGAYYAGGYFSGGTWQQAGSDSPLIDAGAASSPWQNEPQPNGRRANMGAYGNSSVASTTYLEAPGVFTELAIHAYDATGVGSNYATLAGEVLHDGGGGDPQVYICWGTVDQGTTTQGWDHVVDMGTRQTWELFSTLVTNLQTVTYSSRFFATNSSGGDWSALVTFAPTVPPTVENDGAIAIRRRAAVFTGEITNPGGVTPSVWFYYWSTGDFSTTTVSMAEQTGLFSTNITGLASETAYQYSILASNTAGPTWSVVKGFTTLSSTPIGWYVATNGTGDSGTNWATAMTTLYDALSTAESNDTIRMAGHTFTIAGQTFGAARHYDWSTSHLTVEGGYAATNNAVLPGPRDTALWPTVLTRTGQPERVFYIHNCTDAVLRGVTISGGSKYMYGGGLYLDAVGLTLDSCMITSNQVFNGSDWSSAYGAGIYSINSTVLLTNSVLSYNTYANGPFYGRGGGACIYNGSWTVTHSIIKNNNVLGWYDNVAFGGGLFIEGGTHRIANTLFATNLSYSSNYGTIRYYGAGVYVNANLQVFNCTFANNEGEGLRQAGGSVSVTNTILWGNGDDIAGTVILGYCDVEDGDQAGSGGNFTLDPFFADSTYYHPLSRTGYYHGGYFSGGTWLRGSSTSPCIDAADPASPYQYEPSPRGGRANIGYDGNTTVASMKGGAGSVFVVY